MLKQLGAIFLILGTCVAAAMLGLPVVTANEHYLIITLEILIAWVTMTFGAWCILQVNLAMKPGSNLISMSEATLGNTVKWVTWGVYSVLLFCLISAYLAASSDVLQALLHANNIQVTRNVTTIMATGVLGFIVYRGIRTVDLINRSLLSTKLIICGIIIAAVSPHFDKALFSAGEMQSSASSFLVIICAFGYAIIIPSIREYLNSDRRQLKRVLIIGSFIPMSLYLLWIAVIHGAVARTGTTGLIAMNGSENVNSMLMMHLANITHKPVLQFLAVAFISISSITGFLGVSLCTVDFLADGLKMPKVGINRLTLVAMTFLPPMLVVIFKPAIFTSALAYAGLCCIYILIILPIAMYLRRFRVIVSTNSTLHQVKL